MGCDGGSIPRRDEMVKLKKKTEKADPEIELAAKWKHCALSSEKLKKPIVACDLGRLYNKESLLLALLDKPSLPEVAKHIRSLRDVVVLNLTPNPTYKAAAMAMAEATQTAEFVCPISGLEMSGRHRFVFLRGCGCVLSERTLKEVPSQNCHKCGKGFCRQDVVVLNGTEEEVKRQREAMEKRRLEAKQTKQAAKSKRKQQALSAQGEQSSSSSNEGGVATSSSSSSSRSGSSEERDSPPAQKKLKTDQSDTPAVLAPSSTPSSTPSSSANTTATVNGTATKHSLPKGASKYSHQSADAAKLSSKTSSKIGLGSAASSIVKKTAEELGESFKAPAADPTARNAYKSLFHSVVGERPKERTSNWVTFFPYH